jgi:malate dehydrogenase
MISIVGSGKVGSAIAFLCGSYGLNDITLVNRDEKKAIGEALDISNAIPADSTTSISGTADYSQIANSDVIIVTASIGTHQASRSDIMLDQSILVRNIAKKIQTFAPKAKVLMVTNPVDVMTHLIQTDGNLGSKNVLGVASNLDSARFRYCLARHFDTNQAQIHDAVVLGEHDDSMVPIFSHAKLGNTQVNDLLNEKQRSQIRLDVRNYWKSLRDYKGSSVFGIAKNTFDIVSAIIKNEPLDVCASVLLDGQYGFEDVCMGVPVTVTKDGVTRINQITINDEETEQLHKSAGMIQSNILKVSKFLKTNQ